MTTRSDMSHKLGRRISKGEYKRLTTKYVFLPPPYEKMIVLDPECPRAVGKGSKEKIVQPPASHEV